MKQLKKLYEFTAYQKQTIETPESTKDEKGEEVKILRKSVSYAPKEYFLRKPTRNLYDDADLFYGVTLSNGIKEGLLTRAQLTTKFADEIGTLSQGEKKNYLESFVKIQSKEAEYQTLSLKKEEERTNEEKAALNVLAEDILKLRSVLQEIESSQQSLYDHTAETFARNKTILWWLFNLLYEKGGEKPLFGEGDFSSRLAVYDGFDDEEDDFLSVLSRKSLYLISAWYTGRIDSKEEFDRIAKIVGLNEKPEEKAK